METVIGAIAVVFVTSMIIWMNRNAARLKGQLEREAQQAINRGGALALVVMAFLAVLKEGFETAVFLLAAAQTSHGNRWFAVLGGAIGILASIGVGMGLYFGGLKLNLGRFFRVTGVFLVLIAAGLVMGALRTAHEAGWVTIGQQQLVELLSWMPSQLRSGRADHRGVRHTRPIRGLSRCSAGCSTRCRCSSSSCGRLDSPRRREPGAGCWPRPARRYSSPPRYSRSWCPPAAPLPARGPAR